MDLHSKNIQSPTFCPLPWKQIGIRPDGSVRICEWASNPILNSEGLRYNLVNQPLNEILNSSFLKGIKEDLSRGVFPKHCFRCQFSEKTGVRSKRIVEAEKYKKESINESNFSKKINLELRLSNLCSSGCMICTPELSTFLKNEFEKNASKLDNLPHRQQEGLKKARAYTKWYESEQFFNSLSELAPNLTQLYLTGGEPLLIKTYWTYLDHLIKTNYAKDIYLKVSTNLNIYKSTYIEQINKFKKASIYCSMDGIEQAYEYNRYPSKWNKFVENLTLLSKELKTNHEIALFPTIHILTIQQLEEIYKFREKIQDLVNRPINVYLWSLLKFPEEFNVGNLPEELKKERIETINRLITKYENSHKDVFELTNLRSYIENQRESKIDFKKAKSIINVFDNIRGNSWKNIAPEYAPYWNDL